MEIQKDEKKTIKEKGKNERARKEGKKKKVN